MAQGRIQSFDEESGNGYIAPDAGGDRIPFEVDDLVDYKTGEQVMLGDPVTYEVEGGMAGHTARQVRRIATRGYE